MKSSPISANPLAITWRMPSVSVSPDRGEVKFMRVNMVVGIPVNMTCRDVVARLARAAGMLVGLTAGFFLFALLTAGNASANQSGGKGGQQPGLLGGVVHSVTGVVGETVQAPVVSGVVKLAEPVVGSVAPVVHGVAKVVEPVVTPVAEAVAPLTEPVLKPVIRELSPVLSTVSAVTGPITGPIVSPVVSATAGRPLVAAVSGSGRSDDSSGDKRSDIEPAVMADPIAILALMTMSHGQVPGMSKAGFDKAAGTMRNAGQGFVVESGTWSGQSMPGVPLPSPSGPVSTGTSGGTTAAPHGPGVDGSVLVGVSALPRPAGTWRAPPGALTGPSWWSSYGLHHPS
jgi:hypothetical protein